MAQKVTNQQIADILLEISLILEAEGISFKPQAYEEASATIRGLDEELSQLYKKCGIKCIDDLPGIGQSIAKKIEELVTTNKLAHYQKLKKKYPLNLIALTEIQDIGGKTAVKLYKKLGIKTIKDLERAAKAEKISKIQGFGEKTEKNILQQITFLKSSAGRVLIHDALPLAEQIVEKLRKTPGVTHCDFAGSIRRRKETCGDIDLVITTSKPKLAIEAFASLPQVTRVLEKGTRHAMVRCTSGLNADLIVLKPNEYGSALMHFTGNKEHNITLRKIAIKKGMKLSEHGLFKNKKLIAGKTEKSVYQKLGLNYIEPELRTNTGEIKAAQNHKLPKIIPYNSIKGDLQIQTNWSDGEASILEMARAAKASGLSYLAVTDHTKTLAIANGLNEKQLKKQCKEIDKLNKKLPGFKILKSTECEILKDGSLDISDDLLKQLDLVCIALHGNAKMDSKKMTERIIRAMKNPLVNILFHPTGRRVKNREAYKMDISKIIRAAKQFGVALEINSSNRLDLKDTHIREAIEQGCKLTISSDTHSPQGFKLLKFGTSQARRGWATKADILNTKPVNSFLKAIKGLKK